MTTETPENSTDETPAPPVVEPGPYTGAIRAYLEAATWLGVADLPFRVHAESIAKSLDVQLAKDGQVQSALASSFDKVMYRLEARRPPATPAPTDPAAPSADGTVSIFTQLG